MNRKNLTNKLEEQLKCLIWDIMKRQPPDGIFDLTLTHTSVNEEEDTITYLTATVELVELKNDEWVVEDYEVDSSTHGLNEAL